MVGGGYLISIEDYRFDLKSEKINSIARLVNLGIPTVPFPHVFLPEAFQFYLKNKKLPPRGGQELKAFFTKLQKSSYTAAVRPSIFAKIPGVEFFVANKINLPTFKEMTQAITDGYEKIINQFNQSEEIEFAYLLQGFYTAYKAGVVFSDDGQGYVHIEGTFGEHTWLITRGEVKPDIYRVDKKTGKIKVKKIAEKDVTLESSKSGLMKVKLRGKERIKPVFTDQELKNIYQYALRMERKHGPQEIECAVLRSSEVIFQSSRNSQIKKKKIAPKPTKNIPIFLRDVKGRLLWIRELKGKLDLKEKIIITDNLDIDFITKLVYRLKPRGVILTRGSLTAHAVTILREAKVPSVLAAGLKIDQQKFAEIKSSGEVYLR